MPRFSERLAFPSEDGFYVGNNREGTSMPKGYWITAYRAVKDKDRLAKYATLAAPAIAAGGGKYLVRGEAAHVYEAGVKARTIVIEFDTVAAAIATHDSPAYQEALAALGDGAERDIRIVEGVA
ncbi:MAG TPA: DUF1330 domain-containing protein [Rhizomicrobium sp.]